MKKHDFDEYLFGADDGDLFYDFYEDDDLEEEPDNNEDISADEVKTIIADAEKGEPSAQCRLAELYFFGKGVEESTDKATELYRKAAEQGYAPAQYELGYWYYYRDDEQAVKWLRKAAEQGYAEAQYELGVYYSEAGNLKKAMYWNRKAAEQGYAEAQYELGKYYESLDEDEKAVNWFTKAAEQGDPDALSRLCDDYDDMDNVEEAVTWYKKAAEQGDPVAQYKLGVCYKEGDGVEQDDAKAAECFFKAAAQGNTEALFYLVEAAEKGFARAQYYYGVCYYFGWGVEEDWKKAAKWFRKAAKQGDEDAEYALEYC